MLTSVDIFIYSLLVFCALNKAVYIRVLRRKYHICYTKERVDSCCEYLKLSFVVLDCKINLCAYGLAYPVLLHNLNLVWPAVKYIKVLEKSFGVICNLEVPL